MIAAIIATTNSIVVFVCVFLLRHFKRDLLSQNMQYNN
jgi:hypothetical protein